MSLESNLPRQLVTGAVLLSSDLTGLRDRWDPEFIPNPVPTIYQDVVLVIINKAIDSCLFFCTGTGRIEWRLYLDILIIVNSHICVSSRNPSPFKKEEQKKRPDLSVAYSPIDRPAEHPYHLQPSGLYFVIIERKKIHRGRG